MARTLFATSFAAVAFGSGVRSPMHNPCWVTLRGKSAIEAGASVQAGMRGTVYGPGDLDESRRLGFTLLTTEELRALTPAAFGELVRARVGERPVFLTFDVDFLDPAVAPGTGTPEIGGFSTAEALGFLRGLRGLRLAGADVVEVTPAYDGPGQQTALAAANVAWELLALHAVSR